MSRISFNNITAVSENGCFVGGDVPGKVNGVSFNNVSIQLAKPANADTTVFDKRPCRGEGFMQADWNGLSRMAVPLCTENATVEVK